MVVSPTEIFCRLQKKYSTAFRSSNVVNMGMQMLQEDRAIFVSVFIF